jgi:tetratricopeptide (TPR) repeat protein
VYRAHNFHFLTYAAMFDGQSKTAMQAARDLVREVPPEAVRSLPDALDAFIATPYHVMVRFGWWQQILDEPMPPTDFPVTTAFAHYSRTVAYAALGRLDEAAKELETFEEATTKVPQSAYIGNNTALTVLGIARSMGKGELAYRQGRVDEAFDHLRDAVRQDDALRYDEPWGWFQPVRHALGALLLEQGRIEEAEAVYRKDLEYHPGNGWALTGLAECLRKKGDAEGAAKVDAQLAESWARADVPITVSCFCRRG